MPGRGTVAGGTAARGAQTEVAEVHGEVVLALAAAVDAAVDALGNDHHDQDQHHDACIKEEDK